MANGKKRRDSLAALAEFSADLNDYDRTVEAWDLDLRFNLAEIVIRQLMERDMSRAQLARVAGMKPPRVTTILQCSQNWTVNVAARLLHALGTKVKLVEAPAQEEEIIYSFVHGASNGKTGKNGNGHSQRTFTDDLRDITHPNPTLPVVWVDSFSVAISGDNGMLRFYTILPDGNIEVARIRSSRQFLKGLVDVIADLTDYYPQKPSPTTPTSDT
jgi:hypothetical protein